MHLAHLCSKCNTEQRNSGRKHALMKINVFFYVACVFCVWWLFLIGLFMAWGGWRRNAKITITINNKHLSRLRKTDARVRIQCSAREMNVRSTLCVDDQCLANNRNADDFWLKGTAHTYTHNAPSATTRSWRDLSASILRVLFAITSRQTGWPRSRAEFPSQRCGPVFTLSHRTHTIYANMRLCGVCACVDVCPYEMPAATFWCVQSSRRGTRAQSNTSTKY